MMTKIWRDPLVFFLLAGAVIYAVLTWGEDTIDTETISISQSDLVQHIQFRTKTFDDEYANLRLAKMSREDVQDLISQITTEEALYREAQTLGLSEGDYVIRQRLVGKMKYLLDRDEAAEPSPQALEAYYAANLSDYRSPATASFSHVFFKNNGDGQALEQRVMNNLRDLKANDVDPQGAKSFGDRFLFNDYYVDRTPKLIGEQFGEEATSVIFSDDTPVKKWTGPVSSNYGLHLVYVIDRQPALIKPLEQIRDQVILDYQRAARRELQTAMENSIVESYKVVLSPELKSLLQDDNENGLGEADKTVLK